jgi:hypothetical protein
MGKQENRIMAEKSRENQLQPLISPKTMTKVGTSIASAA